MHLGIAAAVLFHRDGCRGKGDDEAIGECRPKMLRRPARQACAPMATTSPGSYLKFMIYKNLLRYG